MAFRHEWKIEITPMDYRTLKSRLQCLMSRDPHAVGGTYTIRSLYFDTPSDRALWEKISGVDPREKFRIRCYNGNFDVIRLEKKMKIHGLCEKKMANVTKEEVSKLLRGDIGWMRESDQPLLRELHVKMKTEALRPKTVVEYAREPYIHPAGHVRVTFDMNLRTGLRGTDFFNANLITVPAGDAPMLMEVKWDEYLPDVIRDAIQLPGRRASAFSKYAGCRIYG